ncbi:phosphotransferase [Actinokineospora globicatena]|uniref:Ternary complex associated domain-containing protein n=1 Tax=Actinokineospora globicatena TaxID=103729 RepID=A0A9W6QLB6_9PSEU|nr:phosphotransferase [Actinokineospora globicatena]GLW90609.1 hypothetical protein Aglo03_14250 [Actinokineospora globicatena]
MSKTFEFGSTTADLARVREVARNLQEDPGATRGAASKWDKIFQALDRADDEVSKDGQLKRFHLLANTAFNLAQWFQSQLDPAIQEEMLRMAIHWYDSANNPTYATSLSSCRRQLATLGKDSVVPVTIATVTTTPPTSHSPQASNYVRGPAPPQEWDDVVAEWRESGGVKPLQDLIDDFAKFANETVFSLLPQARELLVDELSSHLQEIGDELRELSIHQDGNVVHERAKSARRLAFNVNVNQVNVHTFRLRWLVTGMWNFALMQEAGWQSNRPQIVVDLLGYVQSFQIYSRHRDDRREYMLWATRLLLRAALDSDVIPRPLFDKAKSLASWIRHSTGTYLLLSGPEPTQPSLTVYDTRVDPANRDQWADSLLQRWVDKPDVRLSVALSLLSLSDWSVSRLNYLLQILFQNSSEAQARIELWLGEANQLIEATRTTHIGVNPWSPGRGIDGATLSYGPQGNNIILADSTLRGIASELATRSGHLVAQGAIFRGRRVPTFLCFDNFGPVGILKIDRVDRVEREKKNFDRYAKRLHPRYRPSECVVGTSSISDSAGDRFRAVLTSYVFSEEDEPTTLSEWLVEADAEQIDMLINRLFLQSLRPWLSHVERRVGDLRDEYSSLRPATNITPHAPDRNAVVELRQFTASRTTRLFGQKLDHADRFFTAFETLPLVKEIIGEDRARMPSVNPLWLAAAVGECDDVELQHNAVAPLIHQVSSHEYLTCISHGDLHGDNILIAGDPRQPNISLIDFETTHEGHICKDFARLESALLTRIFEWTAEEASALVDWFMHSWNKDVLSSHTVPQVSDRITRILGAVVRLRKTLIGCGQEHWPIKASEYQWAMLASLLPFARYPDTPEHNRVLALVLAGHAASTLCA